MSPSLLFNIYLKELLVRIRESKIEVELGGGTLGCLLYADDFVLPSKSKKEMEEILHIANTHGREWGLKLGERKCKVMEFNTEKRNH